jgi:hypothetical protein
MDSTQPPRWLKRAVIAGLVVVLAIVVAHLLGVHPSHADHPHPMHGAHA